MRQAHPDPRSRYLAHREVQPIDSWNERLEIALFVVGLFAIVFVLAVVAP